MTYFDSIKKKTIVKVMLCQVIHINTRMDISKHRADLIFI